MVREKKPEKNRKHLTIRGRNLLEREIKRKSMNRGTTSILLVPLLLLCSSLENPAKQEKKVLGRAANEEGRELSGGHV